MNYYLVMNEHGLIGYTYEKEILDVFMETHPIPGITVNKVRKLNRKVNLHQLEEYEIQLQRDGVITTDLMMNEVMRAMYGLSEVFSEIHTTIRDIIKIVKFDDVDRDIIEHFENDIVHGILLIMMDAEYSMGDTYPSAIDIYSIIADLICPTFEQYR